MFKSYVTSEFRNGWKKKPEEKEKTCVFCERYKKKEYIFSTKSSFVIVNEYPYNNGHLMILSVRHVKDIIDLKEEELRDMLSTSKKFLTLIENTYDIHSFNLGINLGEDSGATLEHLHFHLVPRWGGDSGFLETTSDTKVLKETPEQTKIRLIEALKNN